ncbi:MAG TPA: hypothetical protein PLX06_09550 [Fimbriimonadaceae bacterium]|nr:hypothetical protein [Fimbriimonadaceae bacterium]
MRRVIGIGALLGFTAGWAMGQELRPSLAFDGMSLWRVELDKENRSMLQPMGSKIFVRRGAAARVMVSKISGRTYRFELTPVQTDPKQPVTPEVTRVVADGEVSIPLGVRDGVLSIYVDASSASASTTPARRLQVDVARGVEFRSSLGAGFLVSHLNRDTNYRLAQAYDKNGLPITIPNGENKEVNAMRIFGVKEDNRFDTQLSGDAYFMFDEDAKGYQSVLEVLTLSLHDPGTTRVGINVGAVIRQNDDPAYLVGLTLFGNRDGDLAFSWGFLFKKVPFLSQFSKGDLVPEGTTLEIDRRYRPAIYLGVTYRLPSSK